MRKEGFGFGQEVFFPRASKNIARQVRARPSAAPTWPSEVRDRPECTREPVCMPEHLRSTGNTRRYPSALWFSVASLCSQQAHTRTGDNQIVTGNSGQSSRRSAMTSHCTVLGSRSQNCGPGSRNQRVRLNSNKYLLTFFGSGLDLSSLHLKGLCKH